MTAYIAPAAMGLGDLVVSLPVIQALIDQGEKVYLVVRLLEHLPLAQRIPGLAGVILEWELDITRLRTNDVYYDLRDHYLQRRYWWGSREFEQAYPGYKINDILGIICGDLGIDVDFGRLPRLTANQRPEVREKILFIPGSAIDAKSWPVKFWLQLADQLRDRGIEAVAVGEPDKSRAVQELVQTGFVHLETPTLSDALDLISSARAVVSVDTGLMHLAVNQQVPTLGIFRKDPVYLRMHDNFRAVISSRTCADVCYQKESNAAHNALPFAGKSFAPRDWSCQIDTTNNCMSAVACADVLANLEQLLDLVKVPAAVGN